MRAPGARCGAMLAKGERMQNVAVRFVASGRGALLRAAERVPCALRVAIWSSVEVPWGHVRHGVRWCGPGGR